MTKNRWRWLVAALVVAAAVGTWSSRRAEACLFGSCDTIIIANQITQIAHMVTQIGRMVEQLQSLDGVLDVTTELVTSNDIGMGNIGRLRELTDAGWSIGRHGIGLATSTSAGGIGAFSQRIPGLTDEAGWLRVLAAPETTLLATRPATEVLAAMPGAFDSWTAPPEAADVLAALEAMGSGGRSYRGVWDDLEALAPAVLTEAQLRAAVDNPAVQTRLVEAHERAQAVSSADLVHAHARGRGGVAAGAAGGRGVGGARRPQKRRPDAHAARRAGAARRGGHRDRDRAGARPARRLRGGARSPGALRGRAGAARGASPLAGRGATGAGRAGPPSPPI